MNMKLEQSLIQIIRVIESELVEEGFVPTIDMLVQRLEEDSIVERLEDMQDARRLLDEYHNHA